MIRTRLAVRFGLLVLGVLAAAPWATAQVKYPPRPDTVDVHIRYRIRADRDERARQFRLLEAHLKQLGFVPAEREDADLDILDPTAERFSGTIPSKNVFAVLADPRVRTILFTPVGYKVPDAVSQLVPVRIGLPAGFLPAEQQKFRAQTIAQLEKLGFRDDVGYDDRGNTIVRGAIPAGNLHRLLKDLRREPSGWFVADTPPDQLPGPFRETLPVRWVEVLPGEDTPEFNPPAVGANRVRFTPDLWPVLDNDAERTRPIRVEVVLDSTADARVVETFRTRLRAEYAASWFDGAVGNVVTIRFGRAGDLERFSFEPGVVLIRRPRAGGETAAPLPPADKPIPISDLLTASHVDQLQQRGYRGQGVRVVVIGSDFPNVTAMIGKELPANTQVVDLTAELSQTLEPRPPAANRVSSGIATARAVHAAAPRAQLILVRVDPTAFFQLVSVAHHALGDAGYSEAMQSRITELAARADDFKLRYSAGVEEYRQAFQNLSDEEQPRLRRENAKKNLAALLEEEKVLSALIRRSLAIHESVRALDGAPVIVNTLTWESGYALDGLNDLSQLIDRAFAGDTIVGPKSRSATRPRNPNRPLWVQPGSNLVGSVWAGQFLDADNNGVMEFAPPTAPIPVNEWTRELNFLGVRSIDGAVSSALPAGARVRLFVQWREPHQEGVYGSRESLFPLTLRLFRQLDPDGTKMASDDLQEVARSVGGPYLVVKEPGYGVYEQEVELTVQTAGRYCLRVEGRTIFDPRLPALRRHIEIQPRMVVEFVGVGPERGRPVFTSFAPTNAGVGMPGDAKSAITVGVTGGLTGAGPGLALLAKPDLFGPSTLGGGIGGTGIAAGFAGGAVAGLVETGANPSELFRVTGMPRGREVMIPETFLRILPPRRP